MGASGNPTSKAARLLLAQGTTVRVIGRDAIRLKPLQDAGEDERLSPASTSRFP
jgi:NADP-dependent 3-hydroxy acid dehydrogenase YdfG